MKGDVKILPVYYKKDLKESLGCSTDETLIKRLNTLGIPFKRDGKDIWALYEDIKGAFKKSPESQFLRGEEREAFEREIGI